MRASYKMATLAAIVIGCAFIVWGIMSGELQLVYNAAATICFSCIGIG